MKFQTNIRLQSIIFIIFLCFHDSTCRFVPRKSSVDSNPNSQASKEFQTNVPKKNSWNNDHENRVSGHVVPGGPNPLHN
ncbi:hypothetical protein RND81_06G240100 [Saponaria officinalis]|uniref:Uncharacterized protein n=1 Tax=Saponaria officinalis TaxID=3572 RepID=A0AAW1KDP6_SAPOF